jgi:hypothetical protein
MGRRNRPTPACDGEQIPAAEYHRQVYLRARLFVATFHAEGI